MRVELQRHPETPCMAVDAITVACERAGDVLRLRYRVVGRLEDVLVPAPAFTERADDLWMHTCFEAFVGGAGEAYCEFNFAPSTQWAAYAFEGYRKDRRDFAMPALAIETDVGPDWYELLAVVTPGEPGVWRLGLSAVIEETSGAKSYWALKHPPGKPDFHHAACFDLELP